MEKIIDVRLPRWYTLIRTFCGVVCGLSLIHYFLSKDNPLFTLSSKQDEGPFAVTKTDTKFSDVHGIDQVLHEIETVVDFLEDPAKYAKMGANIPRGLHSCLMHWIVCLHRA